MAPYKKRYPGTDKADSRTLDLLANVAAQEARVGFSPDQLFGQDVDAKLRRAMAVTLKESGMTREKVARRMAKIVGETFTKTALDNYVSQAKEDHRITVVKLQALMEVTGDPRPLSILAEEMGMALVPIRFLPAIEEALIAEQIEELTKAHAIARKKRKGGR